MLTPGEPFCILVILSLGVPPERFDVFGGFAVRGNYSIEFEGWPALLTRHLLSGRLRKMVSPGMGLALSLRDVFRNNGFMHSQANPLDEGAAALGSSLVALVCDDLLDRLDGTGGQPRLRIHLNLDFNLDADLG